MRYIIKKRPLPRDQWCYIVYRQTVEFPQYIKTCNSQKEAERYVALRTTWSVFLRILSTTACAFILWVWANIMIGAFTL